MTTLRLTLVCFVLSWSFVSATEQTPLFIVNEDDSHFFFTRKAEEMNIASLEAFVDQYAGRKVTHLFLNPNAMRSSFRSKTREAIWDSVPGVSEEILHEKWKGDSPGIWPVNAKLLFEKGIDPYEVWIRRCRQKGISPWLSMRMNDLHNANDPLHFFHSEFWRSNPQFRLDPNHTGNSWSPYALNYAHAEVREHQMAFVEELLERYDADGLELDWLRFPHHLKNAEDAHFIDDFVAEVRKRADDWSKKRGHKISIAVRVPSHPDASDSIGLKAVHWAKQGWVDMIIAATFWGTTDFDIRFDLWRERLGEAAAKQVLLVGGTEIMTAAYPGAKMIFLDVPMLYGFADNMRFRGADGCYLFNWFDRTEKKFAPALPLEECLTDQAYHQMLDNGLTAETTRQNERRYPVCFRNIGASGAQLPHDTNQAITVRILMGGEKPKSGMVFLVLGFDKRDGIETAVFTAALNGKNLGAGEAEKTFEKRGSLHSVHVIQFSCPLDTVLSGDNEMVLRQTAGEKQRLVWVELRVVP